MLDAEITSLLRKWRGGDRAAEQALFEAVMPELRRLARRRMASERPDHTLDPTEIVQHLYLQLTRCATPDWQSRQHFYALAARAMARFLMDYARGRKSGNHMPVENVPELNTISPDKLEEMLQVSTLLDRLRAEHPELCTAVELKFFIGLTDEEAAEMMQIPIRRLQRHWYDARCWLFERLNSKGAGA